jgi:acid stress-induced BolA-like protein IbaG/YrbA
MLPLQLKLQTLKEAIKVKENVVCLALDSSSCQISIIDDGKHFFVVSVDELRGVKKHVDNQQFAMDLLLERMDEGEKELANVSRRFQHSKLQLHTLQHPKQSFFRSINSQHI